MSRRAAIIGVGRGGANIGAHSIGYVHADAYRAGDRCRLVAAADLDAANLDRFREAYPVNGYASAEEMLAAERPELVSICTYASSHRPLLLLALAHGARLIWCEKPFALTADDARVMVEACEEAGAKLVVNHFRRYLPVVREARRLIDDGAIGAPTEFLAGDAGWDLMESGSHWLDLIRFFAHDRAVSWVLGQASVTGARPGYAGVSYGHPLDDASLAHFAFSDGVRATVAGGGAPAAQDAAARDGAAQDPAARDRAAGAWFRLNGTDGRLDLFEDGTIRLINARGVTESRAGSSLHAVEDGRPNPYHTVLGGLLDWADGGPEPEVSLRSAWHTAQLYLAAYQSAVDGGRVDLPLEHQAEVPLRVLLERQRR